MKILLPLLAILLFPAALLPAQIPERPNIIVIIADDLGPDGVGCYGAFDHEAVPLPNGEDPATWTDPWSRASRPSTTPNIDALAAQGLKFTRVHATAICSPSRAQFATGQYPFRNGVVDIDGSMFRSDPHKPSLSLMLKNAGYITGKCGKADIDHVATTDEQLAGWQYWDKNLSRWQLTGPAPLDPADYDYFPDAQTDFVLDFLDRNAPDAGNGFAPFYFLFGFNNPHTPVEPTPDSLEYHGGAPPGETTAERVFRHYTDNLRYIDDVVGAIVAKLGALEATHPGILANTLIVFTGDNGSLRKNQGATLQGDVWDPATATYRSLHGAKADRVNNREGASLVPFVVHWPAGIDANREGEAPDTLLDFTDLLPTFADLAGATLPPEWELHGHSFAPFLRDDPTYQPRAWVYTQIENNWAVRGPDYRLNRDGRFFDMTEAPFNMAELTTLTPAQEAIRVEYQAALDAFDPEHGPTFEAHQDHEWDNPAWTWKNTYFNSAERWEKDFSGDAFDPDGDGVPNIFERLWGWGPRNGTDAMPEPIFTGSGMSITLPGLSGNDTSVIVEVSDDLVEWDPVPATGSGPYQFEANGVERLFMRIRTERITPWDEP